jgi:hypothetical protein
MTPPTEHIPQEPYSTLGPGFAREQTDESPWEPTFSQGVTCHILEIHWGGVSMLTVTKQADAGSVGRVPSTQGFRFLQCGQGSPHFWKLTPELLPEGGKRVRQMGHWERAFQAEEITARSRPSSTSISQSVK